MSLRFDSLDLFFVIKVHTLARQSGQSVGIDRVFYCLHTEHHFVGGVTHAEHTHYGLRFGF